MKKSMKMDEHVCGACCHGACPKCHAGMWLIIGIIFLINVYWTFADWWTLVAWLFVVFGVVKLIKPYCPHCM
ncbi:hypothetical protein HYV50_03905 [Candidatus Pacearchaeota archaeon]|nr:hypothetical protein [Candidatus Pacearchaeota archaeon]